MNIDPKDRKAIAKALGSSRVIQIEGTPCSGPADLLGLVERVRQAKQVWEEAGIGGAEIHSFRLILCDLETITPEAIEVLTKSGCDDGIPQSGEDHIYIDFKRLASNFDQAVTSAIEDVRKAKFEVLKVVDSNNGERFLTPAIARKLNQGRAPLVT